ncbi:hypothetical protein [Paenibacillus medicaginis]|uniref:Chemotaxis methyl-accepting receptor HlyB-like 4HB MCP domain-containing protein n=1 Tax=Paenibacillus medicaginis TaxID=1470560 RepID=A0ABV5C422_9BACL
MKLTKLSVGLIVAVILAATFILYNNQKKVEHGMQMKLESLAGNSLYEIWHNYTNISSSNMLTQEKLENAQIKLSMVQAYSRVVDTSTNTDILESIAKHYIEKINGMSQNYKSTDSFSQKDEEEYRDIMKNIQNLLSLISQVYYDKKDIEGGKASLSINKNSYYTQLIQYKNSLLQR